MFTPHRRSHLRSGTYHNLVRLISLCYGDSPLATAPPIIPVHRTRDNGSNQSEPGGNDIREPGESIVQDSSKPANLPAQEGTVVDAGFKGAVFKDSGFSDTQMVLDEIEQIMEIEESQNFVNGNDLMVCSSTEGTGFQDGEIGREQSLMNELENIMKGNEDYDNSNNCLAASLGQNLGDNCVSVSMNNQEERIELPLVVAEESGTAVQPQVYMEGDNQKIIEAFDFSLDKSLIVEVSKSSEKVEDQSSVLKSNAMHEKIGIQQKEMELEKFVSSNDRMPSPGQMVENGELEEGEIFGDIQLVNESVDILLEDAVVSEKNGEEKQVDAFDDKVLHCNEESKANNKDSEITSFNMNIAQIANRVSEVEFEGSERDQMVSEHGRMHRKKGTKQSGDENQVIKSKKKKDDGVCNKTKQGSNPAEKKEKKKRNKRKKRAEKNQQLGVKRLKLQTVLKPKAVTYCRHYLKGRCYEGEKCKYSHDTVPLTKSQPCSHFARQSCMKGDECPFDHQLSKYPCINYMTKGFCGRGDDCLFSHKMSPEGGVASLSSARELQLKSSLHGDSEMRLSIRKNVDASSCSIRAFSQKSKEQIVAGTPTKTPDLDCKGVNSLFVSKSSMAESSKRNRGSSFQNMKESGKVGIQSNLSTSGVNSPCASKPSLKMNKSGRLGIQANQSESGTIQNVNDSPMRKTEVVPRGINFLSFGKSSLEDTTSKVSLALNRGVGYKQHPSENEGDRGKLSNQTSQSTSSTDQRKTDPTVVPLGINFLSLGKSGNSRSNEASIPSSSDIVNSGPLQKSNYASDKRHNTSAISYKSPVSPRTSGQSSEWVPHKNTPNTAQKAIISTLAFAKKFDDVNSRSFHESQHLSDKQYSSNPIPWKMAAYPLAMGQSSEKISHKNTPNSVQKALMSTLAFAAKFESGMKKNQSAVSTGVKSETTDSRNDEGSKSDLAETSKLLDILSSVGRKIKQM
ncbi:zinc finger CCCH domain-containing protein 65 [Herrania umbratica]|uniref:Zinc finger CCCH domain-containing protein 65 n=1 Tax=Herrania umbratica TaxID=108875 RepID=A0A6J0ZLU7_9ROSI|nr:zinc finger CCCH domain-containing protein 65 [Herrania umbratica]